MDYPGFSMRVLQTGHCGLHMYIKRKRKATTTKKNEGLGIWSVQVDPRLLCK